MIENYVEIPIDRLVKAVWNYKKDDEIKKEKLKNNIAENGQIENIIVRIIDEEKYEVVNGNHRYDAMLELGFPSIVCYNMGNITLAHAKKIAIETNETKFETDHILLAQTIKDITEEFDNLADTMPFSEQEIDSYVNLLDFDWNQFDRDAVDIEKTGDHFEIIIKTASQKKMNECLEALGIEDIKDKKKVELIW